MKSSRPTCLAVACLFVVAFQIGVNEIHAEETAAAAPTEPFVTGRLGVGAMVDSRYSGGSSYDTFPVPLAAIEIAGGIAYIDYWQAGLYVLSNEKKNLGLAIVATPRLGFNQHDGPLLEGMRSRRSSIEMGLSVDYGFSDTLGVSLGYLHDVVSASDGAIVRFLGYKHVDFSERFGVDAFVGVERLNARLANYYYGVGADETTAARAFYQPGAGTDVSAGLHFNFDFGRKSTLLFGYEVTRLGNELANSPIAERRFSNLFYFGYGWRL
jgi:outer membrane scaffolding protein for murein synthesis (MipA/OmpV family)